MTLKPRACCTAGTARVIGPLLSAFDGLESERLTESNDIFLSFIFLSAWLLKRAENVGQKDKSMAILPCLSIDSLYLL